MKRKDLAVVASSIFASEEQIPDWSFRRANQSIGLKVRQGKLSLLKRRIYNTLMEQAQTLGSPGENAPNSDPEWQSYFWVPLSKVMELCDFNSNNTKHFKANLEELMEVRVISNSMDGWGAEVLLAGVQIINSRGPNPKGGGGGVTWLGFTFPPQVYQIIMNPDRFTKFNLYYQTVFTSTASLALYEICRRYATNPSHVTENCDWETWFVTLMGEDREPQPFKVFNSRSLKPAIAEVNQRSDLQIEAVFGMNGNTVRKIQFKVYQKPTQLPKQEGHLNEDIIRQMISLGMSRSSAEDFCLKHPQEKVTAAIANTKQQINQNGARPINNLDAYFRTVLKNVTMEDVKKAVVRKPVIKALPGPTLKERFEAHRANEAFGLFKEMPVDEQDKVFSDFAQSKEGALCAKDKDFKKAITQKAFGYWFAKITWGDPTVSDLDNFERRSA